MDAEQAHSHMMNSMRNACPQARPDQFHQLCAIAETFAGLLVAHKDARIAKLTRQRDELLAALKDCKRELACCRDQLDIRGLKSHPHGSVNNALEKARAAIAAVKGGK